MIAQTPITHHKGKRIPLGKTVSRLAAIQSLYRLALLEEKEEWASTVIHVLHSYEQGILSFPRDPSVLPDLKHLHALVEKAWEKHTLLDPIISPYLHEDWSLERIDTVHLALLRVATAELYFFPVVPTKVIINEYVTLSRHFGSMTETGFINGILEKIAHSIRPEKSVSDVTPSPLTE